mmetsp:Transcript_35199/g.84926  ORF Transcript_35199/g.84926 Transcript_35199/m.84926 type:complete len:686 (-) Transcript_35199:86-2143(-)
MHSTVESSWGAPISHIAEAIEPVSRSKKVVNVTVMILSIAGLFVKDDKPTKKKGGLLMKSKKFPSRGGGGSNKEDENGTVDSSMRSNDDSGGQTAAPPGNSTTTVVASFSRLVRTKDGKPRTAMTHVPSTPLPLLQIGEKKKATNSVVNWPDQPKEEGDHNNGTSSKQTLSSYQFQRTFEREAAVSGEVSASGDGFVPQPLSIQIAISRSGRMFKLGTADILITGEESGESSVNMPIKNCNPQAVVPKTYKKFKTRKGNSEKMIPMMKLKGDTLKCGLDPDATLRVLVHVGEPIGETMELSPKFNVTMMSNSMRSSRKGLKKKMREPRLPNQPGCEDEEKERLRHERPVHQESEAVVAASTTTRTSPVNTDVGVIPSAISWEYNPMLAAVIVKSPGNHTAGKDGDDGPLLRVIATRQEEEEPMQVEEECEDEEPHTDDEEEASCTSSAYMSVDHYRRSYPSKHNQHTLGAHSRSYSTATTTTSLSSVVSELTETRSWLSQTGIEVIPFAPNMSDLPLNSRLRLLEEGESVMPGKASMGAGTSAAGANTTGTTTTTGGVISLCRGYPSLPTRSSNGDVIMREKQQTWRQRLVCGFMPTCGGGDGGASDLYTVDSYLSALNEEDVVSSTNQYLPRCVAGGGMAGHFEGQNTNRSYYTEYTEDSGATSFIDEEDSDSSADSSDESSAG